MPLVIPDNHGVASFHFRLPGDPQTMVTTLGGHFADPLPSLNQYAQAIGNSATAASSLTAIPANVYILEKVQVMARFAGNEPEVGEYQFNINCVGNAGTVIPQNSAFLVRKLSALPGRRHKGRFYLPGVAEGVVDALGVLLPANMAPYNTALANFLNFLKSDVDETFNPVILHNQAPGAPAPPPPTVITSLVMDTLIATQRRRLRP